MPALPPRNIFSRSSEQDSWIARVSQNLWQLFSPVRLRPDAANGAPLHVVSVGDKNRDGSAQVYSVLTHATVLILLLYLPAQIGDRASPRIGETLPHDGILRIAPQTLANLLGRLSLGKKVAAEMRIRFQPREEIWRRVPRCNCSRHICRKTKNRNFLFPSQSSMRMRRPSQIPSPISVYRGCHRKQNPQVQAKITGSARVQVTAWEMKDGMAKASVLTAGHTLTWLPGRYARTVPILPTRKKPGREKCKARSRFAFWLRLTDAQPRFVL